MTARAGRASRCVVLARGGLPSQGGPAGRRPTRCSTRSAPRSATAGLHLRREPGQAPLRAVLRDLPWRRRQRRRPERVEPEPAAAGHDRVEEPRATRPTSARHRRRQRRGRALAALTALGPQPEPAGDRLRDPLLPGARTEEALSERRPAPVARAGVSRRRAAPPGRPPAGSRRCRPLHPLLAFLLLLEELALAGDVAAVALGGHVLAQRP